MELHSGRYVESEGWNNLLFLCKVSSLLWDSFSLSLDPFPVLKLLKWVRLTILGSFPLLKAYEISLLKGNWVSEFKSPGVIQQDEELDCLVQSLKKKKKERVNGSFLKVKEKKSVSWQAENISWVFQVS